MTISCEDHEEAAPIEPTKTVGDVLDLFMKSYATVGSLDGSLVPEALDRDRLEAALARALPPQVSEEIVNRAADWIYDAWYRLCGYAEKGPSKKLRKLHEALSEWVDDHSLEAFELSVWYGGKDEITRLSQTVDRLIKHKESRTRPKGKQEAPLTTFFVSLYGLYIAVSGKVGLTDGGPAYRFVRDCAALVGVHVPESGFAMRIRKAVERGKVQK